MRHHFGAEQMQRAQRVGKRHRAKEEIGQKIIDAELLDLPLDFRAHGRGEPAITVRSATQASKLAPRGTLSREVKPVWPC